MHPPITEELLLLGVLGFFLLTTSLFGHILEPFMSVIILPYQNLAIYAGVIMSQKKKAAPASAVTAATLAVSDLTTVLVSAEDQVSAVQLKAAPEVDGADHQVGAAGAEPNSGSDHNGDTATLFNSEAAAHRAAESAARTKSPPEAGPLAGAHSATGAADAEARRSLPRFADYEIVGLQTKDGLSTTYVAKRDGVDGFLSLRVFNERGRTDAQVRQIQKAAKAASELTHPNVVVVYESAVAEDGSPYVVSELAEGADLEQVLVVAKRLDIVRFLGIFTQVGEALVEAHSRQLIHGNLSPHKILLANNDDQVDLVKLIDFGMPPDPVQNAFYMSPEQCLDRSRLEARTDIYALGCIMYEMLVGTPPFVGHNKSQASLNYLHELANQYSPSSPEHNALKLLDCIITKCLQNKPSKRFSSMRELMNALRLVNDCICNGDQKKLPPKAEKLLLFRFLDMFDKKIVACLFIYFLLGLCSAKYLAEIQLQKYIDQAQLAMQSDDLSEAQVRWKSAIDLSGFTNKPPSLQADLHWELADNYAQQASAARSIDVAGSGNDLALESIKQYKEALNYYDKRPNYKSYALALSANISNLWISMTDIEHGATVERLTLHNARLLFEVKNYAECMNVCDKYLQSSRSESISHLASSACLEAAKHADARQALFYLARSEYYDTRAMHHFSSGPTSEVEDSFLAFMHRLRIEPTDANIRESLIRPALEKGDVETALGFSRFEEGADGGSNVYTRYLDLRESAAILLRKKQLYNAEVVSSLKKVLDLQQVAKGEHSPSRASALLHLADCYASSGQAELAIQTYEQLFKVVSHNILDYDTQALVYADLLIQTHHAGKAVTFLETHLRDDSGGINSYSALYPRLIQAYWERGMKAEARDATMEVIPENIPASYSRGKDFGYVPHRLDDPATQTDPFSMDVPAERANAKKTDQVQWTTLNIPAIDNYPDPARPPKVTMDAAQPPHATPDPTAAENDNAIKRLDSF